MKTARQNHNSRFGATDDNTIIDMELQMIDEINISEFDGGDFDKDILEMPSDMYDSIY